MSDKVNPYTLLREVVGPVHENIADEINSTTDYLDTEGILKNKFSIDAFNVIQRSFQSLSYPTQSYDENSFS